MKSKEFLDKLRISQEGLKDVVYNTEREGMLSKNVAYNY